MPAERAGPLARYAATIQAQRGDYNGRVLSIRQDDLRTLAVIYDESPSMLTEQLITWGVLNPEARRAVDWPPRCPQFDHVYGGRAPAWRSIAGHP